MTTTNRKSEHEMIPHYRVTVKANGVVVWEIESESGMTYHTTWYAGKVTSCEQADGQPCKGWRYRSKNGKPCHHAQLVMQLEIKRAEERRAQEHDQERPLSEKGVLNGNRGFRLMR